ncbi:DUF1648 domain-containing protein [Flavobacterium sp.]|uniref:DUF1648 domain-containing protein n=1 Tax=Flavobacterium sp. TaxID=239 RepID=UPI000ED60C84|nr:DUF1648 domain-containing protein [Flavobacterium sp.]HCQ13394.1 hypothetical protein [Flavobacterium sp.]
MEKRPKIKVSLSLFDTIIEVTSYLALVAFWVMTIFAFTTLPESIPTHYNGLGEVDGYGPKATIFFLPVLGTVLFAFLTYIVKKPETFNYTVEITEENALAQYTNSTKLLRFMKLALLILFIVIDYKTIATSNGASDGLGKWFLPFTIALIFVPVVFSVYRSFRK